jgi:hypothetical protein
MRGCLLALLVVIGLVLLLPGVCSVIFIAGGDPNGIAVLGLLVSVGGLALIVYATSAAMRRPRPGRPDEWPPEERR